ncbi:hypothetical protein Airi01_065190 [Actinoallomurus iriomotensis]|uniref:Uncharacterized protein n=1 Tax=Actinoallomurus iriomotensis TaxID=478107 RepID=A0A9W6RQD5_9ACTN|nr:hypothetical protein Airi01_065190 [Actinoallomurus iriomotensis]
MECAPALRAGSYTVEIRGTALNVTERMGLLGEIHALHTAARQPAAVHLRLSSTCLPPAASRPPSASSLLASRAVLARLAPAGASPPDASLPDTSLPDTSLPDTSLPDTSRLSPAYGALSGMRRSCPRGGDAAPLLVGGR